MEDSEIARRLRLISVIVTPVQEVKNQIVRVEETSVTVESERTEKERRIPFEDIRNRSVWHGCIIDSFRQILGLGDLSEDAIVFDEQDAATESGTSESAETQ
jgi:hypothetical protein